MAMFAVGDAVECRWLGGASSYPGKIEGVEPCAGSAPATYTVKYDDGDVEERVPWQRISRLNKRKRKPTQRALESDVFGAAAELDAADAAAELDAADAAAEARRPAPAPRPRATASSSAPPEPLAPPSGVVIVATRRVCRPRTRGPPGGELGSEQGVVRLRRTPAGWVAAAPVWQARRAPRSERLAPVVPADHDVFEVDVAYGDGGYGVTIKECELTGQTYVSGCDPASDVGDLRPGDVILTVRGWDASREKFDKVLRKCKTSAAGRVPLLLLVARPAVSESLVMVPPDPSAAAVNLQALLRDVVLQLPVAGEARVRFRDFVQDLQQKRDRGEIPSLYDALLQSGAAVVGQEIWNQACAWQQRPNTKPKPKPTRTRRYLDDGSAPEWLEAAHRWCAAKLVKVPGSKVHVTSLRDDFVADADYFPNGAGGLAEKLRVKTTVESRTFLTDVLMPVVGEDCIKRNVCVDSLGRLGVVGWELRAPAVETRPPARLAAAPSATADKTADKTPPHVVAAAPFVAAAPPPAAPPAPATVDEKIDLLLEDHAKKQRLERALHAANMEECKEVQDEIVARKAASPPPPLSPASPSTTTPPLPCPREVPAPPAPTTPHAAPPPRCDSPERASAAVAAEPVEDDTLPGITNSVVV